MATYYNNLLTITGPDVQAVLAAVKADAPHVDTHGQSHQVYFDPQRICGSHKQNLPHIFPDDQKIWDEDGSAAIRFETAGDPAFYPTLWLSEMSRASTLKLRWLLQSGGSDPSVVLFRAGEASHVYEIPNYNRNTGKSAILFEIFCSHINRFRNGENLGDCIGKALEVVGRVKAERLAEARKTSEEGDHAADSGDPEIVYNQALDKEMEALIQPFLYSIDMIPVDEGRIAKLVADLRSIENPAQRLEFLKTKTCLDLNFIVPEAGRPVRFAILPCDLEVVDLERDASVVVPVIHYTNADPTTGKYTKTPDGTFPDIEWKIRYLYATRDDLREIKKLSDDKQAPCDIDIVMTWSPRSITMKHGGPSGPIYGIERVSNHARWKKDPAVVAEVEAAIKQIHPDRAEAKMTTIVVGHDLLTSKDPRNGR